MIDIEQARELTTYGIAITAISVTLFSILYAFRSAWRSSALGVTFLAMMSSFALFVDTRLAFRLLRQENESFAYYLLLVETFLVAVTTTVLTAHLWVIQHGARNGEIVKMGVNKGTLLSNDTYDHVKKIAQVGLPAVITLYAALGSIWGWPSVEQVVASLGAVNVFLGVVLGISVKRYNESDERFDGRIDVTGSEVRGLELFVDPRDRTEFVVRVDKD